MSFTNEERILRHRARNKIYYESNKDRIIEHVKNYRRKHVLHTTGGRNLIVRKRDYPKDDACEICSLLAKEHHMHYHHWDDEVPEFGMWLCYRCHIAAGAFEQGFADKYSRLKQEASKEACFKNMPKVVKDMVGIVE